MWIALRVLPKARGHLKPLHFMMVCLPTWLMSQTLHPTLYVGDGESELRLVLFKPCSYEIFEICRIVQPS